MTAKKIKKEVKEEKPLTERQKFHKFYREEYMKDAAKLFEEGEPHHVDKHGVLGYEENLLKTEVWSDEKKKYVKVEVFGLCEYCTKDRDSAEKAYDKS